MRHHQTGRLAGAAQDEFAAQLAAPRFPQQRGTHAGEQRLGKRALCLPLKPGKRRVGLAPRLHARAGDAALHIEPREAVMAPNGALHAQRAGIHAAGDYPAAVEVIMRH